MFLRQPVPDDHVSNLLYLIRLGQRAARLEAQDLLDTFASKNVMIPPNSLRKTQPPQQLTQFVEANTGVGRTTEDPIKRRRRPLHGTPRKNFIPITCCVTLGP